jgi:hypothetical protein
MELQAKFNAAGNAAGGGAGASHETSEKKGSGSDNMKVEIFAYGHKRKSMLCADSLAEAVKLHREFGVNAIGTGVAHVLQPFDIHEDYQEAIY